MHPRIKLSVDRVETHAVRVTIQIENQQSTFKHSWCLPFERKHEAARAAKELERLRDQMAGRPSRGRMKRARRMSRRDRRANLSAALMAL